MNLINMGTSFSDMLFTLGRYYVNKIPFILDFNIALAQDLSKSYQILTELLFTFPCRDVLPVIEEMHERMYSIFYNCYFYRDTKKFAPQWILTDVEDPDTSLNRSSIKRNKNRKFSAPVGDLVNEMSTLNLKGVDLSMTTTRSRNSSMTP